MSKWIKIILVLHAVILNTEIIRFHFLLCFWVIGFKCSCKALFIGGCLQTFSRLIFCSSSLLVKHTWLQLISSLCESNTTYMRVKLFCLNASSKNADIQLGHRTQSVSDITLYQVAQSQTTGMPNNLKVSASKEDISPHDLPHSMKAREPLHYDAVYAIRFALEISKCFVEHDLKFKVQDAWSHLR